MTFFANPKQLTVILYQRIKIYSKKGNKTSKKTKFPKGRKSEEENKKFHFVCLNTRGRQRLTEAIIYSYFMGCSI